MRTRALDVVFREHEGDDYMLWLERNTTSPQKRGPLQARMAALASVGQWVIVLAGSSLIAWLAQ